MNEASCFINQVINKKYGATSKMWKLLSQTAACYLLSAAPAAPKLVHRLIYVLAWWDVVVSLSLAGCVFLDRARTGELQSCTPVQNHNVQGRQLA